MDTQPITAMFLTQSRTNRPIRGFGWPTIAIVLGGVLILYYIAPIIAMVATQSPGTLLARIGDPVIVDAAATSVLSATITTLLSGIFGIPLAYGLARTSTRWKSGLEALIILPLVLPPTVGGVVLLSVVGPQTLLGTAAATIGVDLTRSLIGVILAQTFVASPFAIITARAAFSSVDVNLEYASRSLGQSRWTTFRQVTLPLAWPGIIAGLTLTFARAIGEFGATLMLAYYPRTMPVQIWVSFIEFGLEEAYPVAVLLILISMIALAVLRLVGQPWGT